MDAEMMIWMISEVKDAGEFSPDFGGKDLAPDSQGNAAVETKRMRTSSWNVVGVVVLAVLSGCHPAEATAPKKPVPVKVRAVEKAALGRDARYSGTLEPAARVDVAFRVGGYVESIGKIDGRNLEKGDEVKKGTLLARVRSADYAQKVATARAAVAEATAAEKLARQELDRAKHLLEKDATGAADLDAKSAQYDSARAQLEGAMAREREASIAVADTVIVAPMDGVVLARQVEVGSLVTPGVPAFVIADTKTVKVVFGVSQTLVEKLRVGTPLSIITTSEGSHAAAPIAAQVTRIAPAAEGSGRVFSVEASLPNPDGALRPGSVVSIHIPDAALAEDAMVVPLSAVVRSPRDAHGFAVFVLDGTADRGPARLHDVRLGDVLGNGVTVVSGLSSGQRIVTVGATLLRDGDEAVVIR
jgi:RND family efflux transporter MFP subunit